MRNVSHKKVAAKKNTQIWSLNFVSKIVQYMCNVEKIWSSQTGHKWQYTAAQKYAICMLDN